ncbi:MAG: thioredoxin family protein [Chitinophagaceae bacterium]|nr:thioredoxin family protein [Chitinophagaceae bacterium]
MRTSISLLLFGLILFIVSCKKKAEYTDPSSYQVVVINENWSQAVQQAKDKNQHIFLLLHADWCGICKGFIADVMPDQDVALSINNKIIVAMVDGDMPGGADLKTKYAVSAYPTMVIVDKDENTILKRQGQIEKQEFVNWITPYLK